MIKIIDDLLPKSYADQIERDSLHFIQYFWNEKTVVNMKYDDPNIYDFGQLTCPLVNSEYNGHLKYSEYFVFMKPMLLIVQDRLPELDLREYIRVKFNMLHQVDSKYQSMYNTPHPDDTETDITYSMVYYVNDSDGDTVMFNEFYDKNKPHSSLTIHQRIKPKKNRLVVFDSRRYHASSNPTMHQNRTVLNFVLHGVKR